MAVEMPCEVPDFPHPPDKVTENTQVCVGVELDIENQHRETQRPDSASRACSLSSLMLECLEKTSLTSRYRAFRNSSSWARASALASRFDLFRKAVSTSCVKRKDEITASVTHPSHLEVWSSAGGAIHSYCDGPSFPIAMWKST